MALSPASVLDLSDPLGALCVKKGWSQSACHCCPLEPSQPLGAFDGVSHPPFDHPVSFPSIRYITCSGNILESSLTASVSCLHPLGSPAKSSLSHTQSPVGSAVPCRLLSMVGGTVAHVLYDSRNCSQTVSMPFFLNCF